MTGKRALWRGVIHGLWLLATPGCQDRAASLAHRGDAATDDLGDDSLAETLSGGLGLVVEMPDGDLWRPQDVVADDGPDADTLGLANDDDEEFEVDLGDTGALGVAATTVKAKPVAKKPVAKATKPVQRGKVQTRKGATLKLRPAPKTGAGKKVIVRKPVKRPVAKAPAGGIKARPLPGPSSSRPALAFVLTQGWANDLVTLAGTPDADAALQRTIDVLKSYTAQGWDTYAILDPQIGEKTKLLHVLDALNANGVRFALEALSSDAYNLGGSAPLNAPAVRDVGLTLYPNDGGDPNALGGLLYYVAHYPQTFRGLRIMEPDFCFQKDLDTSGNMGRAEGYAEQIVAFAHNHDLWVEFNSIGWDCPGSEYCPSATVKKAVGDTVARLAQQYPGVVYPTWPTNDGTNVRRLTDRQLTPWETLVDGYTGERGFGLSDQSWLTGIAGYDVATGSPQPLIDAAHDGLMHGVSLIQMEPYWYFFKWDAGAWTDHEVGLSSWGDKGGVTQNHCAFAHQALRVNLPGC